MTAVNEKLKKRVAELEERLDYLYEENIEFKRKIENLNEKILDIMKDHIIIIKDYYELKNNNENKLKKDSLDEVVIKSVEENEIKENIDNKVDINLPQNINIRRAVI